jgi:hypothetical protein
VLSAMYEALQELTQLGNAIRKAVGGRLTITAVWVPSK